MDYEVRDRGKILGQFSIQEIEHMLDSHKIGMMAEAYDGGSWVTLEELMEKIEAEREANSRQLRQQQDEAEKKASQARQQKELELEIERQKTQQQKIAYEKEEKALAARSYATSTLTSQPQQMALEPHRGSTILTLGILSLFLCGIFTGIPAWVMGKQDLAKMKAGTMDPQGEGATRAGMICGMIICIIAIAVFGFIFLGGGY